MRAARADRQIVIDRRRCRVRRRVDGVDLRQHAEGRARVRVRRRRHLGVGVSVGGGQRQAVDRARADVQFDTADLRRARRIRRIFGVQVEVRVGDGGARQELVGIDVVEVDLRVLAVHDIARDVHAHLVVQEVGFRADFIGLHRFRSERAEVRRAVVGATGAETARIFGVQVDAGRRIGGQRHHRVEPAAIVVQHVIGGDARHEVQSAVTLVLRIAAADRQVQHLRRGGGPGRLAVRGIAAGAGDAGALQEAGVIVPALVGRADRAEHLRGQDGVGGAVGVPLVRRGRRGGFAGLFVEIIEAGDPVELVDAADRLEFLAELALVQIRQAVAAELAVGGVGDALRTARIVPLVGRHAAPCGDRLQRDRRIDLVRQRRADALRLVDAVLLRHADVGDALTVRVDADQRGQRRDAGGGRDRARQAGGRAGRAARQDDAVGGAVEHADGAAQRVVVDQLAEERRVLVTRLVEGDVGGEAVGRLPARGDAAADAVIGVPAELAGERVARRRILMLVHAVQLDRDVLIFGQVDMRFAIARAVIAEACGDAATEFPGGRLGDDAERAAFGVATEQRALRTTQHFDALHVEQRGVQALRAAEVDAVDIDADARIARGLVLVERHDAADADRQRRLARFERGDAQAGHRAVTQIEQALDVAVLDRFGIEHADRDRRLLQVGFALGRGDDDVLQLVRLGRGGRVRGGRGIGGRRGSGGRLGGIGGERRCGGKGGCGDADHQQRAAAGHLHHDEIFPFEAMCLPGARLPPGCGGRVAIR